VPRRGPEAGSIAEKMIFMVLVKPYSFMSVSPWQKKFFVENTWFYDRKASNLLKKQELVRLF
jgi:hypothetical protein